VGHDQDGEHDRDQRENRKRRSPPARRAIVVGSGACSSPHHESRAVCGDRLVALTGRRVPLEGELISLLRYPVPLAKRPVPLTGGLLQRMPGFCQL
jgi:hypothetical protein